MVVPLDFRVFPISGTRAHNIVVLCASSPESLVLGRETITYFSSYVLFTSITLPAAQIKSRLGSARAPSRRRRYPRPDGTIYVCGTW
jgi:hypothetical protein